MSKKIARHREYKGCTIWLNDKPGFALRWTSTTAYRRVAADTLAGIKELISEDMDLTKNKR